MPLGATTRNTAKPRDAKRKHEVAGQRVVPRQRERAQPQRKANDQEADHEVERLQPQRQRNAERTGNAGQVSGGDRAARDWSQTERMQPHIEADHASFDHLEGGHRHADDQGKQDRPIRPNDHQDGRGERS
jgi:hypothetical protein